MAGFLNSTNLRLAYRAAVPYISNPFVTMAQTSVEVARRYLNVKFTIFEFAFKGLLLLEDLAFMCHSWACRRCMVL